MASTSRKNLDAVDMSREHLVDVSREIIIDTLVLTRTLMHAIRNNLPIDLERCQIEPVEEIIELTDVVEPECETHQAVVPQRRSSRRALRIALLLAAFSMATSMVAWALLPQGSPGPSPTVTAAHALVLGALDHSWEDPHELATVASTAFSAGDSQTTVALLGALWAREQEQSPELARALAGAMLQHGDGPQAQALLLDALTLFPGEKALLTMYKSAVHEHQAFKIADLDRKTTQLILVDASVLKFRVQANGQFFELFLGQGWEKEVAAYRLCAVLDCAYRTRQARQVDISTADFLALYDRQESPRHISLRARVVEALGDGETIQGALLEEPILAERFPIENTRLWRTRLRYDEDPVFSRQISHLISADYLMNHPARFQKRRADWGRNVGISDNVLISQRHTGAFETRVSRRVEGRLDWVDRFDRRFVETVKALDSDLGVRIVPGAENQDHPMVRTLITQRDKFLAHVEPLRGDESRWTQALLR